MKTEILEPQKFSEFFNLPKIEYEFLDIYANQDILLFLDPYGISCMQSTWSKECESQIASYFQYLVDSIKSDDKQTTSKLLNAFHEVDEVALGYSVNQPNGRGIGPQQAKDIQKAFETSAAVRSGDIKDIADCALMIPGINRDKVSDITANILKNKLIEFTQAQCAKFSIPLTRVATFAFDYQTFQFRSFYTQLPVIKGKPKILLPISSVRRDPDLSKDKFYRNFVIEFLKAEHQHAGDALASVLKNGNVIVRISDLKSKYPLSADFLYEFSKANPEILKKYKSQLKQSAVKKRGIDFLKTKPKTLRATERMEIMNSIIPGNDGATKFHKISFDNLIYIFAKMLSYPYREKEINDGRKRIDIVFNNSDKNGFFYSLNTLHHVHCPKIFIECKNYGKEIGNPEIDQLIGRFSAKRGRFGIVVCRSISDRKLIIQRCRDVINDSGNYIIVLDDNDINQLLIYRDNNEENKINQYFTQKLDELIM
jgi:hypothetical protein